MQTLCYLILAAVFCCLTAASQAQVNPVRNFNPVEASANTQAITSSDGNDPLDLRKNNKYDKLLGWDAFSGINGPVYVTAVNNGYLYIGGRFTQIGTIQAKGIARLNLTTNQWSALGSSDSTGVWGLDEGTNFVQALEFSGDSVFVGGQFFYAGNVQARRIAVWNSSTNTWSAMADGFANGAVLALKFYKGELIAGGTFDSTGTTVLNCLAKWDGTSWTSFHGGVKGGIIRTAVMALAVNPRSRRTGNDGSGLFVGGNFTTVGPDNINTKCIVRWADDPEGSGYWESLGNRSTAHGVGGGIGSATFVSAIGIRDGYVYVGGNFTTIAGTSITGANRIARYSPAKGIWTKLGTGVGNSSQTYTFAQLNNATTGPFVATIEFSDQVLNMYKQPRYMYVGGFFQSIGNTTANNLARAWIRGSENTVWQPVEDGVTNGSSPSVVWSFATQDSSLYLGGQFGTTGANQSTTNLACWDKLNVDPAVGSSGGGGTGGSSRQGVAEEEAVEEEVTESEEPAVDIQLGQNRPNPFSELSKVDFSLTAPSHVVLTLFNGLGVPVMKLMDAEMSAGDHNVSIDGAALPAGVYYYRLQTSAGSMTRQLVITK